MLSKWPTLKDIELCFTAPIVNLYAYVISIYMYVINVQKWDGKSVFTENVNKPMKKTKVMFLNPRPKK